MNRHERRRAAALGGKPASHGSDEVDPKAKATLHTAPESVSQAHLAVLMTLLSFAYTAALKIPGAEFPIHIVVEFGGVKCCGTVEPSTVEDAARGGLAEQVLAVVVGQAGETVRIENVEELWHATRRAAGIEF